MNAEQKRREAKKKDSRYIVHRDQNHAHKYKTKELRTFIYIE